MERPLRLVPTCVLLVVGFVFSTRVCFEIEKLGPVQHKRAMRPQTFDQTYGELRRYHYCANFNSINSRA